MSNHFKEERENLAKSLFGILPVDAIIDEHDENRFFITRNKKDYVKSNTRVISPQDFLREILG